MCGIQDVLCAFVVKESLSQDAHRFVYVFFQSQTAGYEMQDFLHAGILVLHEDQIVDMREDFLRDFAASADDHDVQIHHLCLQIQKVFDCADVHCIFQQYVLQPVEGKDPAEKGVWIL